MFGICLINYNNVTMAYMKTQYTSLMTLSPLFFYRFLLSYIGLCLSYPATVNAMNSMGIKHNII